MSHLLATPHGLTFAGVILAKRNSDGSFAIAGHEKRLHAQLQAAYGKPVQPQAMGYIRRGCELLAKVSPEELRNAAYPFHPNPHARTHRGDDFSTIAKGLMMFALTGLNDMDDPTAGKERLLKMQRTTHPNGLLKSYGLPTWEELTKDAGDDSDEEGDEEEDDSGDDSDDGSSDSASGGNGGYNPDEPRIPAGQPGGGQWTTGGNGVSSDSSSISADDIRTALSEDFDNYDPSAMPQGTQVAANNSVQSDAVDDNNDAQDITKGIQTDDHGFIAPVETNPDASGNPVNQVNIFIGGAGDQTFFGNVENSTSIKTAYGSNYYFTNDSNNSANSNQDSLLQDFIDKLPDDAVINIIGHSWGADTAAKVAVDNPGVVDTLITIDPVSHTPPNFSTIKSSVDTWVNVNAVGSSNSGIFSDIFNGNDMASIGGHWSDKPNGIASAYLATPQNHADFNNMMVYTTLPNGKTPQQMLNEQ